MEDVMMDLKYCTGSCGRKMPVPGMCVWCCEGAAILNRNAMSALKFKLAAAQALLSWATEPQYVIRFAASESMLRFISNHFEEWTEEYKQSLDVRMAAEKVRAAVAERTERAERAEKAAT